jgi:hypothetical protein
MTEFDVAAVDLSGILNTTAEQKAKQLPDPKTFRLLVRCSRSNGGIPRQ